MGEDSTAIKESSGRVDVTILRLKMRESVEVTVEAAKWHVYTNGLLLTGMVLHSHTAHTTAAGSSSLPSQLHIPFHIPLPKFLDQEVSEKVQDPSDFCVRTRSHVHDVRSYNIICPGRNIHLYVTTYNIHLMKQIRIGKANSLHPEVKASQSNNIKY